MDKISPIKRNILYFIENQSITKTDFCKKIGVSYANFKGKSLESEVGGDILVKILYFYPNINIEWLLTGKGEMLKNGQTKVMQEVKNINNSVITQKNGSEQNIKFCPLCKEKDERIKELKERINELNEMIDFFKNK